METFYHKITVVFLVLIAFVPAWGQEERELGSVSRTYAITNVTIIQSPGRQVDGGTLVIKDGLIKSVGKNIAVPPEAIIIKGDSLFVYAGFIDGLSRVGVVKPREEIREKIKDPGNPPPDRAGISPYVDVRNFLNTADKNIEELRAIGFTTAHVVPYGGMLPGQSAIISLAGKSADDMVLVPVSSLYSELTPNERVYPVTVIGVMAKWRELYRQAVQAKSYEAVYASNRSGLEPPATNRILVSFNPVIDKRIPVLFKAEKFLDIQRVLALQSDLGFSLLAGDIKEGWDATTKLKASGTKVFLSLDLPEDKKKDDKKSEEKKDTITVEKDQLEKRKDEFMAKHVGQAFAYQQAGISFGFATLSVKTRDIQPNLRRMIKAGLTEDQALAALTINSAQLLGLSDRLGSLDPGKIANVIISERPYFHEKSKVKYVFVEGVPYKLDSKDSKKEESKIQLEGDWSLTATTPQGKSESTLNITKTEGKYKGKLSGNQLTETAEVNEIKLEGRKLNFSCLINVQGQQMKITIDATVEGDFFKGTVQVEGADSFPVEGKKVPKLNR
ncbi:MAG TPA: amidohydrolase family protein [Ohtaekwangia sp.]